MSVALGLFGTSAFADGFVCQTVDGDLNVKVYNHTQAEYGTRTAAVMVVSDPTISHGRKTIAVFRNATLESDTLTFTAKVDMRFTESARGGELIAGTKLGQLKTIALDVDFTYGEPLADGETVDADLILTKRNGDVASVPVICERYLKN
jgi:hypothetical protein